MHAKAHVNLHREGHHGRHVVNEGIRPLAPFQKSTGLSVSKQEYKSENTYEAVYIRSLPPVVSQKLHDCPVRYPWRNHAHITWERL